MNAGLVDLVEALLFVSTAPATLSDLANAANVTEGQIEQALELLAQRLEATGSLTLVQLAHGYQLSTKPEFAEAIATYLRPERQKLGKSQLEVLAIIAYRQPMTCGEIEALRGVQSDYSVHALLDKRLIRETGRKKAPGRPILYGTTDQFLHQFNLGSLDDLPKLERADSLTPVEPNLFGSVES